MTTEQGIIVTCTSGHQQTIYTPDHVAGDAHRLAALIKDTSCRWCGSWVSCAVFGYPA